MSDLTIIMYHYVRPIKKSAYPYIKGRELSEFIKQLDYICNKYKILKNEEVIFYIKKKKNFPKNSCWLTFDDGYKDHYLYVYPELKKRSIEGIFFPPGRAIMEKKILDVNLIHHILGSAKNIKKLISDLNFLLINLGITKKNLEAIWSKTKESRYDPKEIMYVKNMLQKNFDENLRTIAINELFKKYVSEKNIDELNLYMNEKELKELLANGMSIGSHGYNHQWLGELNHNDQLVDIKKSLDFIKNIGQDGKDWIMCYPYGSYNLETIKIIKKLGAIAALTTVPKIANLTLNKNYELPRLDTNDIPIDSIGSSH